MAIHKFLCCLMMVFLSLSQLAVDVFANTNYCAKCRHGSTEKCQHGVPVRVLAHTHCAEAPPSCCDLVTPCRIVQVEDAPFLATEPENQKPVAVLGMLTATIAELSVPEGFGVPLQPEAVARSAPFYLQYLTLLC